MARICLSIDVEWAPEFVIEWMVGKVKGSGLPATWFATHSSDALNSLVSDPAQEIGLHPNFLPGSTHGNTMEEVMNQMKRCYPNAIGLRAHGLFDSSYHQRHYYDLGIKYVSNIIVPNSASAAFYVPWTGLWQIPISWEDDVACGAFNDPSFVLPADSEKDSTWVLNFHPIYCYLNDEGSLPAYKKLKKALSDLSQAGRGELEPLRMKGRGLCHTLDSVLKMSGSVKFTTMKSIYEELKDKSDVKYVKYW